MRKIATITPLIYEGHLVLAFHSDWIKLFDKIPTFIVQIDDDGRLHLISEERIINDSRS